MRNDSSSLMHHASASRIGGWLVTIALAMTLAGCAAMKLGYNNADTLVLFQLDSYFELNPEQEQTVKERMNPLLAWHRSTQLRDYAAFVDKTRSRLGGPVTAVEVMEFNGQLNTHMMAAGDKAAPDIAHLALTLAPEQIDRAAKKLSSDTAKARRELARNRDKDAGAERVKKYSERAQSWLGRLTDEQKEIIHQSFASRQDQGTWWIDERERRQRAFIALLRKVQSERPAEEVAARWFRTYFAQLNVPPDAETRARTESYRRGSAELVARLLSIATPEQRALLSRKLTEYAHDFKSLAGVNSSG